MGVDSIEVFLKNVTVIQSNLELMGEETFHYNEYLYMVHTAVDYFMSRGGPTSQITRGGLSGNIACYVCDDTGKSEKERITQNAGNTKSASTASNIWIGDSGASCHMTCSEEGQYDCKVIRSQVKIGNGHMLNATKIGKKKVTVVQRDGSTLDLVLQNCKLVPQLFTNLFSKIGRAHV